MDKLGLNSYCPNGGTWTGDDLWTMYMNVPITLNDSFKQLVTYTDDKKMEIKLAVPGVKKEDLEITVTKDTLEISYNKESTFVASFTSAWDTKGYDAKNAKTNLADGVLEIIMEKKDSYKPKKLKI